MEKEKKKFRYLFIVDLSYSESGEYLQGGDVWQFIQNLLDKQKAEIIKDWEEIKSAILPLRMESLDPEPFKLIELGADAILKGLEKEGLELPFGDIYLSNGDRTWKLQKPEGSIGGVVVIIPEEESCQI